MSDRARLGDASGFVLLEVVVALIILSVTLATSYSAIREGIAWLGRSDREEAALILAEATLARAGHDLPLHEGAMEGRSDAGFAWHLTMRMEDGGSNRSAGHWVPYRLDVIVDWSDGKFLRRVNLSTVRLGPRGNDHAG